MSLAEYRKGNHIATKWDGEMMCLLTQLWNEGVVSSQIALALNQRFGTRLTTNSVGNRARRLRLKPRKVHLEARERAIRHKVYMTEWRAANKDRVNAIRRSRYQSKSPWTPESIARLSELWAALVPREAIARTLQAEFALGLNFKAVARKANILFGARSKIIGRPNHFEWTQAHLDRLSALWAQDISGTDIAAKMSEEFDRPFTRNSILGKARWLDLPNRSRGGANRGPETDPIILAARLDHKRKMDRERYRRNYVKKPRVILSPEERHRRKLEYQRKWDRDNRADYNSMKRLSARSAAPIIEDFAIPTPRRKTLFELGRHDCRWPVGEPQSELFFFCGAVAEDKRPYCPAHCKRAYLETRSY